MILYPQEPVSPTEAKFKLQGFPDDAAIASTLERFYHEKTETPRSFVIYNMFDELIYKGAVDAEGKIAMLESIERPREKFTKPTV